MPRYCRTCVIRCSVKYFQNKFGAKRAQQITWEVSCADSDLSVDSAPFSVRFQLVFRLG